MKEAKGEEDEKNCRMSAKKPRQVQIEDEARRV
jgi:hypothetical protein